MQIPNRPTSKSNSEGSDLCPLTRLHNSTAPIHITMHAKIENINPPFQIIRIKLGIPITFTNVRDLFLF